MDVTSEDVSKYLPAFQPLEGFHVTSYQANFAIHHMATAMLVSYLHGAVLKNPTKCPITFDLVHTIIPNYN